MSVYALLLAEGHNKTDLPSHYDREWRQLVYRPLKLTDAGELAKYLGLAHFQAHTLPLVWKALKPRLDIILSGKAEERRKALNAQQELEQERTLRLEQERKLQVAVQTSVAIRSQERACRQAFVQNEIAPESMEVGQAKNLNLATSFFTCTGCDDILWYPSMIQHRHSQNVPHFSINPRLRKLSYDLLVNMGDPPEEITQEEMYWIGKRLVCLCCEEETRVAMTWCEIVGISVCILSMLLAETFG